MTFAQIARLFIMRCTLRKMLMRRGYTVPDAVMAETQASLEQLFSQSEEPDLTFTVTRPRTPDAIETLMVFFPTDMKNIGINPIRDYLTVMAEHECTNAIIVVHEGLTSPAVTMLRDLELKGINIAAFTEGDLLVDIYEHEKVPRHILLTPDEKAALLRRIRGTVEHLPKIQRHDPMARYLGLKVDDVVKIIRTSIITGTDVYYRAVVDSEDFN
jgi:DNA-directed RNA polymerase I, II, and III subunit RPABC1